MSLSKSPSDGAARPVVLVTGVTGFIGGHVASELGRAGYQVRALARPSSVVTGVMSPVTDWVTADLSDGAALAATLPRLLEGVTAVVHCAAVVGERGTAALYRRVNVEASRLLVRAAAQAGCRRFVHISSLGVYAARDHFGTDETTPPSRRGIDSYTQTKIEAERAVLEAAAAAAPALHTVLLRPGFAYGPGDRSVMPRLAYALRNGRFIYCGGGAQQLDNTYVGNIAHAVLLALTQESGVDSGAIFNITDARLVTRREFVAAVARELGLPEPRVTVPRPVLLAMTKVYEPVGRLLTGAPALSMARYKFVALNLAFSIDKARRVLGYAPPTDFRDGIKLALTGLRDRGAA
jgi:nucleoside-diphosphate-sugar epimerase